MIFDLHTLRFFLELFLLLLPVFLRQFERERALQERVFCLLVSAVLTEQDVVFQAEADAFLGGLAVNVEVDEASVDGVFTRRHLLRVVHVVPLPVTQLLVRARATRCLRVVLPDDHLTHFVDEVGLFAREQAENGGRGQTLAREKAPQVEVACDHLA